MPVSVSDCLVPFIRKQVDVVLRKRFIGLGRQSVTVKDPETSTPSLSKIDNCDRFTMVMPYAGDCVEFYVIFQGAHPECPPDFLFTDLTFFVPVNKMETLQKWDFRKSDCFYKVLKELLSFFKKSQADELIKFPDLNYEYLSMFDVRNFTDDDIEVFVPIKPNVPITMLVKLHVEFADILPEIAIKSGEESALLLIMFSDINNQRLSTRIYFSDELTQALGINDDFVLPNSSRNFQLNRYVLACEDRLRCRVDLVASRYESRKAYFAKFLSHFQNSIIEYDIIYFHSMVFLLEVEEFNFLLEINLPENYPEGIPDLVFRSVYHTSSGVPNSVVVDSYPYNPRWSLDKVLRETVKFIEDYATLLTEESDPYF